VGKSVRIQNAEVARVAADAWNGVEQVAAPQAGSREEPAEIVTQPSRAGVSHGTAAQSSACGVNFEREERRRSCEGSGNQEAAPIPQKNGRAERRTAGERRSIPPHDKEPSQDARSCEMPLARAGKSAPLSPVCVSGEK
jgi:hypothetical protein